MSDGRIVRIGGATAAWNDSPHGVRQFLAAAEPLDYMVFDMLAESVMGRLSRMRLDDPGSGFAKHWVDNLVGPYLVRLRERGIRVIANAGGVNPQACARALQARAEAAGVQLRIAVVDGSDVSHLLDDLAAGGAREMFDGRPLADALRAADPVLSFTAYLGAIPVARALAAGADVVITGRIVDSATSLGALMHEFGWRPDDYDRLAAGTLVGHLLECSLQVTGGTFTDWQDVPDWANIGYPVAECRADGSAVLTKPAGTGGLVSVGTVAEQLLYEVRHVGAYLVPDVACDFTGVQLEQVGPDRVLVSGARGRSRPASYKACLTYEAEWRGIYAIPIIGRDAVAKAQTLGEAVIRRTAALLRDSNRGPWTDSVVEAIGGEAAYGPHAAHLNSGTTPREAVARIAVQHPDRAAVELFLTEAAASIMLVVGSTMPLTQSVTKVQHIRSLLVPKSAATVTVALDDGPAEVVAIPLDGGFDLADVPQFDPPLPEDAAAAARPVPLEALAWLRSGDKGDLFNVAVIAREARFLPWIAAAMTPEAVGAWYAHLVSGPPGPAERQYAPGLNALNFVVEASMGGGLGANIRFDTPGKGNGQLLLDFPIPVPADIAAAAEARTHYKDRHHG